MMNNALEIKDVCRNIGTFKLDHVSLQIPQGCVMGFAGRNGAGKTTLMNTIMDIDRRTKGSVLFYDRKCNEERVQVLQEVAYIPDQCPFHLGVKIKKLINIMTTFYNAFDIDMFIRLCESSNISVKKKLNQLSLGRLKLVQFYAAIARKAKILILDEPMANLDPVTRNEMIDKMHEFMLDPEHAIFISSHIISDLEKISDYITIIQDGEIILSESIDHIQGAYFELYIDEEERMHIDVERVMNMKRTRTGYTALCHKNDLPFFKNIRSQVANIETIMCYMVGE